VQGSAITSKQVRYRPEGNTLPKCISCSKVGHVSKSAIVVKKGKPV
jgi:hypothetical protein